ncbi:hypothetical protein [Agrobacterium tumefaciens]|uniref:hypothetical protein n=1 Tax=Agrobacterium tumefaciens TaxID=358 RepID=UPI0015735336|nr:hypothetical protein [Agrobacterium tumefaciens]
MDFRWPLSNVIWGDELTSSGEKVRRLRIAAYFGKPTVSQRFRLSDTQPNIKLAQMPVKTGNVARRHLATRDDNQLKDF